MNQRIICTSIVLVLLTYTAWAQTSSAVMEMQQGVLDKAKTNIDKATNNEKSARKAKTWYYRGEIYARIAASDPNLPYLALDKKAIDVAYEAYQKAKTLEEDKKGYYKDAQQGIENLQPIAINHAVSMYKEKDLDRAIEDLKVAHEINPKDTTALSYGSVMSLEAKKTDDYLFFAEKLLDLDIPYTQKRPHYINVAVTYRDKKEIDKAANLIQEAIKENEKDKDLHLILGELYLIEKQHDKALQVYENAYKFFPDDFTFVANLGRLHYDKASRASKKLTNAEKTPTPEETKAVNQEIEVALKDALPYLEKAHQMEQKDLDILDLLAIAYDQLGMDEKREVVKKKIAAIEKS